MAIPYNGINQMLQRMRSDNVFTSGVQKDVGQGISSTQNALRAPTSAPAVPNVMQAGMPVSQAAPAIGGPGALNIATGNIFGGGIPAAERSAALQTTPAVQTAGVLSGLQDQGPQIMFQQRLRDAGINLNPEGQSAGDYMRNVSAAQGIYSQVYGGGQPANGGSIQAIAPTGLRERALSAQGTPVWGQGDVMAQSNGFNPQGGQRFSLGQVMPVGGPNAAPVSPQNPIEPSPTAQAPGQPQQPNAYQQNAATFKNHLVTQQMQAGLLKALPPGYMLDPNRPNAIMPIPGGPAELKLAEDKKAAVEAEQATHEKARQAVESANLVIGNIDKIIPQIGPTTSGAIGMVASKIPTTSAFNIEELKKPILSNIGIGQLKAMREASKNGASGFGQLSEKELDLLQASLGSLNAAQNEKQLREAYEGVKNHFEAWKATYDAGRGAANGTASLADQAKAILAVRNAQKKK